MQSNVACTSCQATVADVSSVEYLLNLVNNAAAVKCGAVLEQHVLRCTGGVELMLPPAIITLPSCTQLLRKFRDGSAKVSSFGASLDTTTFGMKYLIEE